MISSFLHSFVHPLRWYCLVIPVFHSIVDTHVAPAALRVIMTSDCGMSRDKQVRQASAVNRSTMSAKHEWSIELPVTELSELPEKK